MKTLVLTTLLVAAILSSPVAAEVIFDSMPGDNYLTNAWFNTGYFDTGARFIIHASRFIVDDGIYADPTVLVPLKIDLSLGETDPTYGTMDVRIHLADNPDRIIENGDPEVLAPGTVLGEVTVSTETLSLETSVHVFSFPGVTLEPGDYYFSIEVREQEASQVGWNPSELAGLADGGAIWESHIPDHWLVFESIFGIPPAAMRIDANFVVPVESVSFGDLKALYR